MGAFSFHIELKPPNRDGTQSLRIRITRDRAKAYLNLGLHLKKGEFNPKFDYRKDNYITSKHPRYQTVNEGIRTTLDELDRLKDQHHDKTAKELKALYEHGEAEQQKTVWEFLVERIGLKREMGQYSPAQTLYSVGLKFKAFSEGTPERDLFRRPHVSRFAAHLQKELAPMTAKIYLNALEQAHRAGVLEGVLPAGNPFDGISIHAPREKQPRPLAKDLLSLHSVSLEDGAEYHARNFILALFLLHGARANEGLQLKWSDVTEDYVSYLPSKKATRKKHIPYEGLLKEIMEQYPKSRKYVFPYLTEEDDRLPAAAFRQLMTNRITHINYQLKTICNRLEMERLTTHQARRSFTDKALLELKDLREAQAVVGHQSIATTEHYAGEVHREKIDAASRKVYADARGTEGEHETRTQPDYVPPRGRKSPHNPK